ncbi:MAG: acyl carrier protein [Erysipelotrichaceae bacterium]|nr:acyl carrier protein [Erysipelotrichaceae bacterium]
MDNFSLLVKLLQEKVGVDPKAVSLEASMKDLKLDSLDLVEVVLGAEAELGITFEDEELLNMKTIRDVVDLLDQKTKK